MSSTNRTGTGKREADLPGPEKTQQLRAKPPQACGQASLAVGTLAAVDRGGRRLPQAPLPLVGLEF